MDRYRIEAPLGEGAMAQVYRAMDLSLNRPVALKILKADAGSKPLVRQRFLREAQASARLSHPNIVQVYDAGESEGRLYLALELVPGRTLEQVLEEDATPPREFIGWMERIARGIHHAHQHGVVHRDLKPANIIISETGEPKVADFGLAHLVESESALTQSGTTLGTPLFMSPEQVAGHVRDISPRTDVYALGAILYQGLTGKTPHGAQTIAELYGKILNETPCEPRILNPRIPPDLQTSCLKALEKEPSRRYATAEAFADDLKRHLDGESIRARPLSMWGRMIRKVRRNKAMSAALAALLMVGLALGGILLVQRVNSGRRAAALQRLSTLWATITERKRDLRQLKAPAEQARAELERAISEMDAYVRDWPDEPQGYYVRARGKYYLGNLGGAARDLETALARQPAFRPGWSLLGVVKIDAYQEKLSGESETLEERMAAHQSILKSAIDAFARGLEAGREHEESERWGLPWTREDQVMERVGQAFHMYYLRRNHEGAIGILQAGTTTYHAEEYALFLGIWAPDATIQLQWFNRAAEWGPGYAPVFNNRAHARVRLGDFPGGLVDLDRAIELQRDYAEAYYNRGLLRHQLRDFPGALADCDHAIELRGDFAEAFSNRAIVKQALGNLTGALADSDQAILLQPDSARLRYNRGALKEVLGDPSGAMADYDHAILLKGDFGHPYCNRGRLKRHLGDLPGSLADYEKALAFMGESAAAYYNKGLVKKDLGDLRGALADVDRAIDIKKDYAIAYDLRGVVKHRLGDIPGALGDFDRTIELKGDAASSYYNRAVIREQLGDLPGARTDFDHALRLKSDFAEAYQCRGRLKLLQRDLPGARTDLDHAIEIRKDYPEAFVNRGMVKKLQGDLLGAIADFDRAIELKRDFAEAYNSRGIAKKELKDYPGAMADYNRAIDLKGDYAEGYANRANLKVLTGDVPGALPDFRKALAVAPAGWPHRTEIEATVRRYEGK